MHRDVFGATQSVDDNGGMVHPNSVPTTVNRYLHYCFMGYVECRDVHLLIVYRSNYQIIYFYEMKMYIVFQGFLRDSKS
jgi:hypothetical protein